MPNNSTIFSTKFVVIFIAIVGAFWAWCVHQHNINYLSQQTNLSDCMVHTADDASYIVPAYNFKKTGVWKDNSQGVSSYVQRPPLIGIINWGISFFNSKEYNGWQKYFSVLLHFFAVIILGITACKLFGNKVGIIVQSIYALVPVFWGYLFYYISESITPSLFIFLLFGYVMFNIERKAKWLIFQGFVSGLLLMIRPQLGIFLLPFLYSLFVWIKTNTKHKWVVFIFTFLLAFGAFTSWEIRSVSISHQLKLHPIYHVTNNSQYRPVHGSFTSLYKTWEHVSPKFHSHMISIWYNSPDSISFENNFSIIMGEIPVYVLKQVPTAQWRKLFTEYNEVGKLIRYYENNNLAVPGETEQETKLRAEVDQLTQKLKLVLWKENHLFVPLRSIGWTFSKSQLNLKIFQTKYRGIWWMELLRYTCVIFISLFTLLSVAQLFNYKNKTFLIMALAIIGYLFYLFFIQKMNEERYLMPLLPIILIMGVDWIKSILQRFKF